MKYQWKDITSYSQGDTNRTPGSWEMSVGSLRIVVTRHIDHDPTDWLLDFSDRRLIWLKNKDIDKAKVEALKFVYDHFSNTAKLVKEALAEAKKK